MTVTELRISFVNFTLTLVTGIWTAVVGLSAEYEQLGPEERRDLELAGRLRCEGQFLKKVIVGDERQLRDAVSQAQPGTMILIEPGVYRGGFYFTDVNGQPDKPIIIAGLDPDNPPIIKGGDEGIHFVEASYLQLHNLVLTGARQNGLNIDDGTSYDTPAHHIVLRGLAVSDVGPDGNRDGIKLSGVDDFRIENCTVVRWSSDGSAIDIVGCHNGVIENSRFSHTVTDTGSGIQAKGGSRHIRIRRNRFENAGARAIAIGGSTGFQFFRPPLSQWKGPLWEARDIVVEGNAFIGSSAPIAFVGVDGAVVRFNTLYRPKRWALRILQETKAPGFVPSRSGVFTDNVIVFFSSQWAEGGVNIGPDTAPETFQFARNWWYCMDDPTKSRPRLPTQEQDGVYGRDPMLRNPERGDLRLHPNSPARHVGMDGLPPDSAS